MKPKFTAQVFDCILAHHLIQPDLPHSLGFVASIFLQKPYWKDEGKEGLEHYCCKDVDGTLQIALQLKPLLKAQNLYNLYQYTQVPLAKICHLLETTGIHTDGERGRKVREQYLLQIQELEKQLPKELQSYDKSIRVRQPAPAGTLGKSGKAVKFIHIPGTKRVVPWNSPDLVAKYLYTTLGLPPQFNAKTKKLSTDKHSLDKLFTKSKLPKIKVLKEIKAIDELTSNFLSEKNIPKGRGKINPHFSPYGTSQGRLSSSGPNMQNQPKAARYIYVPSNPEWCLIEADFSGGENRLTAWYANDVERMQRLSQPGYNEHKQNAHIFFDIPYDEVVKDNDREAPYGRAKALTHGMNYGEGARKIAQALEMPEKKVKELLLKWRLANQPTVRWMESTANQAEKDGVLTNIFGRKRWFWSSRLYTESLSMLPQSTLADISYAAMISLMYERINWPAELALKVTDVLAPLPKPARMLLQVHDSILCEAPKELVPEVVRCLKTAMEQPFARMGGFSLSTEISVGAPGMSWAELNAYEPEG